MPIAVRETKDGVQKKKAGLEKWKIKKWQSQVERLIEQQNETC